MATPEVTPYITHEPGDLITAEDWNGMQTRIRREMAAKIATAKEEVKHEGVERADNADHFNDMSEKDLTDKYDKRYASKQHEDEGPSGYRRYIKRFTDEPGMGSVLLEHGLGRFPLVDVYELLPVVESAAAKPPEAQPARRKGRPEVEEEAHVEAAEAGIEAPAGLAGCKLLFYYGHADADALNLRQRVGRERVYIGLPFEEVLRELDIEYQDDDQIEDVLNEMWDAFSRDPNDELEHCTTDWVDECCGGRRTIKELKDAGDWDDLRLALRPRKCGMGADGDCRVRVNHINYSTLYLEVPAPGGDPLDLMILLRA